MLIVERKEGEKIDRLLNRYKKKFRDTKLLKDIRGRKEYIKPSKKRRTEKDRAKYIQSKKSSN